MSSFDVGTAFVRVVPVDIGFQAALQAQVNRAVSQVQVPPVVAVSGTSTAAVQTLATAQTQAAVSAEVAAASEASLAAANEALAASASSAATGTEALSLAQASGVQQTAARVAAELALTKALQAETAAQNALTAAIAAGAAETRIAALTTSLTNASTASSVARLRLEELGKAAVSTGTKADILQGSIVGISRVTAISALGLTAWSAAAVAAGLAIRSAITSTADFEHQLNVFQGTTNATADEMRAVSDEAKALGADLSLPATSAGDAAVAMTELAKAGLSVQEALAGAKGVLQLAAAAQISVGTAAEFVATELNAFGLAGDQATHVADLLAGASIAAQGSIEDFGSAFQQVSAVSHQVNLSLEETTGALTELAQAGLRGADGGTSLRTTLLRLAPTTKQAAEFQKALGIQIDNTKSIGEQLPDLLDQYKRSLEALTPVQQQQTLAQIFGQDAIRAASILIQGGSVALRENTDAANQNGAAARLAEANARGLSGAFAGLKSNLDTLGITAGGFVKGPLTDLIEGLSLGVGGINKFIDALDKLIVKLSDVPGVSGLASQLEDFAKKAPLVALGPLGAVAGAATQIPGADALLNRIPGVGSSQQANKAIEDAKKQNEAFVAELQKADEEFAKGIHDEGARFGNELVQATKVHDESRTAGIASLTEAQKKALRDRVNALNKASAGGADLQVKIPVNLQSQLVDAQIAGNLKAEAAIDQKIIDFLKKKRERLDHNTAAYVAIGQQIRDAERERQSILDQAVTAAGQQVKIPIALENAQLDAEIAGNLQAELKTDQKIVDFLTKALERAKGNAVKYKAIAEALKTAISARDAALSAIQAQRQQEQQRQQEIFQTGLQNQQTRLELAAQASGVSSNAEQRLIAFLTKEAHDKRLTDAQRLAFEKERRAEIAKVRAAVEETANAEIELQNAILETKLSAAQLTPETGDDERIFNLQIKALNDDIVRQKKLASKVGERTKEGVAALIQVQQDLQKINALKGQIKGLTGQGQGFSLADLFKEATNQFQTFGSNIAGRAGILSPQDARASLGRDIIAEISGKQLTEQEKQTALLTSINDKIGTDSGVVAVAAGRVGNAVSRAGNFGGWRAAQEAANNLYGAS